MMRRGLPAVGELIGGRDSAAKTGWTIALGFAIGMFPLMGLTTIVCAAIAGIARLRQVAIQLGNWSALPLQIVLLIPFLRIGERITGAERFNFDPHTLLRGFPHVPESTARAVVMAQWHMVEGWAVVAVPAFCVVGIIVTAMLRRRQRSEVVNVRRAA